MNEENQYLIIDDENLDTEKENWREVWKERFYLAMVIILGLLFIEISIITDWLPNYLAKKYAQEKSHIKTGCLYQSTTKIKNYTVYLVGDAFFHEYASNVMIPNTPFYEQRKILPVLEQNKCYPVEYIEVDLKIYKKNFIYRLLDAKNPQFKNTI